MNIRLSNRFAFSDCKLQLFMGNHTETYYLE